MGTTAPSTVGIWISLTLELGQHLVGHGHVGSAKVHQAAGHLANAAAGADRLIVDLDAGMRGAVLGEPFGIDRIRKSSTCAGQLLSLSRAQGKDEQRNGN